MVNQLKTATTKELNVFKEAKTRAHTCDMALPYFNSRAAGMPPQIAPADNVNHLLCGEPLPIVFFYPPIENKWATQLAVWLRC